MSLCCELYGLRAPKGKMITKCVKTWCAMAALSLVSMGVSKKSGREGSRCCEQATIFATKKIWDFDSSAFCPKLDGTVG